MVARHDYRTGDQYVVLRCHDRLEQRPGYRRRTTGSWPSPPGTLTSNVDGYVDYLDGGGRWVGRGGSSPATAVYIRRWAVRPLASDPDDLIVLEVVVGTRGPSGMISRTRFAW